MKILFSWLFVYIIVYFWVLDGVVDCNGVRFFGIYLIIVMNENGWEEREVLGNLGLILFIRK